MGFAAWAICLKLVEVPLLLMAKQFTAELLTTAILEALEPRIAPAVFLVNSTADTVDDTDNVLKLREANLAANVAGSGTYTIRFDTNFFPVGRQILLSAGEMVSTANVYIQGPGSLRWPLARSPCAAASFSRTPLLLIRVGSISGSPLLVRPSRSAWRVWPSWINLAVAAPWISVGPAESPAA